MAHFTVPEQYLVPQVANSNNSSTISCLPCRQRGTLCTGDGDSSRPCGPCLLLTGGDDCIYLGTSAAPQRNRKVFGYHYAAKESGSGGPIRPPLSGLAAAAGPYSRPSTSVSASLPWTISGILKQWNEINQQDVTSLFPKPASGSVSGSSLPPAQAPPSTPLSVASTSSTSTSSLDPDDPQLTVLERAVLLRSFTNVIPPDSHAPFHQNSFKFVEDADLTDKQALEMGETAFRFYRNKVLETATLWLGSLVVMRGVAQGTANLDSWLTRGRDLVQLSQLLRRRMERLVKDGITQLKSDAARFARGLRPSEVGELLQNPENLALQYSIFVAPTFGFFTLGEIETGRAWFMDLFDLMRLTRIPGEYGFAKPKDYGSWMLRELWVRLFTVAISGELTMAAAGGKMVPAVDAAKEFPMVPFPIPDSLFNSLPAWKRTPDSPPKVDYLLSQAPRFTCGELLSWVDPTVAAADSLTAEKRHEILKEVMGDLSEKRAVLGMILVMAAFRRLEEFVKWLRSVAGLRKLDLVIAETVANDLDIVTTLIADSQVTAEYFANLFSNPQFDDALSRMRHFKQVFEIMQLHLPSDVVAAWYGEDFEGVLASILRTDPNNSGAATNVVQRLKTLASLAFFELGQMILVSPEPFSEFLQPISSPPSVNKTSPPPAAKQSPGSSTVSDSSSSNERVAALSLLLSDEDLLSVWFSSPPFVDSIRRASLISRMLFEIQQRSTPELLHRQMGTTTLIYSAIYAAWLQLLTLRRIQAVVAGSATVVPSPETKALCANLVVQIEQCLAFLDKSGRPQARQARMVIAKLLAVSSLASSSDGRKSELDPEEFELVMMTKELSTSEKK